MGQIAERIRERIINLFPERQIYVRTDGDSRYFSLKSTAQIAGVAGIAILLAGTAIAFLVMGQTSTKKIFGADIIRLETEFTQKLVATQQAITENSANYEQKIETLSTSLADSRSKIQAERAETQKRIDVLSTNLTKVTAKLDDAESISALKEEQITQLEEQIALILADEKKAEVTLSPSQKDEAQLLKLREKREILQKRLVEQQREKDVIQSRLAAQIDVLQSEVTQIRNAREKLTNQLEQAEIARLESDTQVEQLTQRLTDLQASMATQKSETDTMEKELSSVTSELSAARLQQQSKLESADLMDNSVDLTKQNELEKKVADLLTIEDGLIGQLEKSAEYNLAFVERVIRNTGLDVDILMDSLDSDSIALGGPFLDLSDIRKVTQKTPSRPKINERIDALNYQLSKLSWLEIALKSIPLAAPVENARITSKFGPRKDPFNRKSAFHSGLDLAGARGTDVRTTGPGVVVFAGRRSSYGNFVEIDHGHGIRTRYAHMNSVSVETGDKVEYMQKVGEIGSSGRSTGVHLHYEVTFNGEFLNPKKFIEAGRDVFKIQDQFAKVPQKISSGR